MQSMVTSILNLERAGKVVSLQSRPFDPSKKTLLLLSPVGTQCSYMTNAALFLINQFNLIILESDAVLSYAIGTDLNPTAGVIDFFWQMHKELTEHVTVDGLMGYCSSAPVALIAATQGSCRKLLLLNGAYFLKEHNVAKSQYERDVERMMRSIHQCNFAEVYSAVSTLYANSVYPQSDYRYQQVRPFRELQAFRQYLMFLNSLTDLKVVSAAEAINMPAFVWCASKDQYTESSSSKYISQLLRNSKLVEDPQGRHHDFVDGHKGLYNAMTRFLTMTE